MREKQYKPVPDLECLKYHGTPEKPDIKIFVSHRIDLDSETIDNPLYIPVRCGAVFDEREGVAMLGDDTGDNISEKRESFCELTVLYWAWKNIEADYYGLCHYRRYLSFADERFQEENEYPWGCVHDQYINEKSITKYGLEKENLFKAIVGNDIITSAAVDVSEVRKDASSVAEYCKLAKNDFRKQDLEILREVVKEKSPQFLSYFDRYMNEKKAKWYNCFVMEKKVFRAYCQWLFPILFEIDKKIDKEYATQQQLRQIGFFGEHLFGVYMLKLKDEEKQLKYQAKQVVFFSSPDRIKKLLPYFNEKNIPIIVMSSALYAAYLAVYIQSLIDHISLEYNYDVIVLHDSVSDIDIKRIESMAKGKENLSIRFFNAGHYLGKPEFSIAGVNYAREAYYRLFSPWILPEYNRVIISDIDMIFAADPSELFSIDMEGYFALGVRDILWQGMITDDFGDMLKYLKKFPMRNPYNYVNTGVLVLNIAKMRETYNMEEILKVSQKNEYRYQEQCIMNLLLEDRVKFISPEWNYYVAVNPVVKALIFMSPHKSYEQYLRCEKHIKIYHYAAKPKPWENPEVYYGYLWWEAARKTLYYDILTARMWSGLIPPIQDLQFRMGLLDSRSGLRGLADKWLPKGTRRREFAKKILPKDSLRWRFCKKIYYFFCPQYARQRKI